MTTPLAVFETLVSQDLAEVSGGWRTKACVADVARIGGIGATAGATAGAGLGALAGTFTAPIVGTGMGVGGGAAAGAIGGAIGSATGAVIASPHCLNRA